MANNNIGPKRLVVGAHYGLKDWLAQRVTAIVMAIFTIVTLVLFLGAPELGTDERFVTGRARTDNRPALKAELERLLAARTAVAWTELIREAGIPVGPIYTFDQVFDDEQVKALKMVVETTRADGSTLPLVRGPLSINHAPTPITKNPPALGEDTDTVLASYGLTGEQIAELRAKGVVR